MTEYLTKANCGATEIPNYRLPVLTASPIAAEVGYTIVREACRQGAALDDFGTGFASLTHLKRFPHDRLKIDRSFVTTFGSDPADTAIVTAIVGLARDLGLHTISEGIEDAGCARLLATTGCNEGPGLPLRPPE